jgi:hypothetical protein
VILDYKVLLVILVQPEQLAQSVLRVLKEQAVLLALLGLRAPLDY